MKAIKDLETSLFLISNKQPELRKLFLEVIDKMWEQDKTIGEMDDIIMRLETRLIDKKGIKNGD